MFDKHLGDKREKTMADYIVQMVSCLVLVLYINILAF